MAREETIHMRLPLEDVTVIDLSHALAGPFCSTMLADFGARVIKLEPTGAGDIARAWGSPLPGGETAYFVSLHRNKQGIEVDLKHKALLPYQTFRTRSRDLALAVGSEKLWQIFCPAIGRPELADDPRYRRNADRAKNRASLIALLQEVFLTKTYEQWEAIFLRQGIPFGAINNLAQLVEHPQVKARGVLVEMEHPRAGKVKMVGAPVRLSETPGSVRTPSPMLGEHTAEVLRELLGMSPEAVAALREQGVIGGPHA
jgi:crotonobetainyl-CoA:carnitine CoA-transferase CaiB-like acyl-CoA transferase